MHNMHGMMRILHRTMHNTHESCIKPCMLVCPTPFIFQYFVHSVHSAEFVEFVTNSQYALVKNKDCAISAVYWCRQLSFFGTNYPVQLPITQTKNTCSKKRKGNKKTQQSLKMFAFHNVKSKRKPPSNPQTPSRPLPVSCDLPIEYAIEPCKSHPFGVVLFQENKFTRNNTRLTTVYWKCSSMKVSVSRPLGALYLITISPGLQFASCLKEGKNHITHHCAQPFFKLHQN